MEQILKPKDTIKRRLIAFLQMLLLLTTVFIFIVLQYSIGAIEACNLTLEAMSELEAFFDELGDVNRSATSYLLYADSDSAQGLDGMLSQLDGRIEYLKKVDISGDFYRSVLDIERAFEQFKAGVAGMPGVSAGAKALLAYYDEGFLTARHAVVGIEREEADMSSKLLTVSTQLQEQLTSRVYLYGGIMVLMLVFWGVLVVRYGMNLSRWIAQPIERLTQTVRQVDYDRIEQAEPIAMDAESDWEVANLTAAFNGMIARMQAQWQSLQEKAEVEKSLHEQEMENLRMAGLLKTSQLQALQRQINPHFLFNTLNVIMDTAYFEEAPETVELLRCAAAFLRYSLDYCEKEVTLTRELEALGEYVFLQEKRFGDRIRFEFDVDEEIGEMRVPALILQPLVENAVAHGVGTYAMGGCIRIGTTRAEGGLVRISVEDNGDGIGEEELARLRGKLQKAAAGETDVSGRGGIGLANVARKIQVYYRGAATMAVSSEPGKKTEVSLLLPVQEAC